MIIKKVLSIGINLTDPIGTLANDNALISIIRDKYENKCYAGCMILKVDEILRMGECVISRNGSPDHGTIPVTIAVTALVYEMGDVITGCTVIKNDGHTIIFRVDKHIGLIKDVPPRLRIFLSVIVAGDLITVQVSRAVYNIGAPKIDMLASIYVKNPDTVAFALTPFERTNVTDALVETIAHEEQLRDEMTAEQVKIRKAIEGHIYPFKKAPANPPFKSMPISELTKGTHTLIIGRDPRIKPADPLVYTYAESAVTPNTMLAGQMVVLTMLRDYAESLRIIREMVSVYEHSMQKHKHLWAVYDKIKM